MKGSEPRGIFLGIFVILCKVIAVLRPPSPSQVALVLSRQRFVLFILRLGFGRFLLVIRGDLVVISRGFCVGEHLLSVRRRAGRAGGDYRNHHQKEPGLSALYNYSSINSGLAVAHGSRLMAVAATTAVRAVSAVFDILG